MSMHKCPRCLKYFVVGFGVTNVEHDCSVSSNTTLSQEDIPLLGSWVDYTGSGTNSSTISATGIDNKSQFSDSWIVDKEKMPIVTDRGANAMTHRQRAHCEFIELSD